MLTLFSTLVLLSVLILIHELGHFLAAKAVDIEVQRFSLGMGPKVAGVRVGETEFVLSALPLGGYVSMAGMQDDESAVLEGGQAAPRARSERDFDAKPLGARVMVVSAGVIMNFLFAVFVFALIPLIWGEQLNPNREVVVRAPETLPAGAAPLAQVAFGAELVAVNERPVETWNDITRALIDVGSGPVTLRFSDAAPVTFEMPVADSLRLAVIGSIQPLLEPVLGRVIEGQPAAEAGLREGDRVVAIGGTPIRTWWELQEAIRASPGAPLVLEIEREGERFPVTITPEPEREAGRGAEPVGRLGVGPHVETVHRAVGPVEAMQTGFQETWRYSTLIVTFLGNLITGHESPRQVGSLLTIGQLSGEFARAGLEAFLWFMAVFSINLAVLNLLPIPILDGGHLMFMAIEAVRGRPLSLEQRVRLSHLGLIIVVGIMVWALTNDVLRVLGI